MLIEKGADADRTDNSGRSARDYAVLLGARSNMLDEIERAEAERASVDTAGLESLYAEFLRVDADFKRLVTQAQLSDASTGDVFLELAALHEPFRELVSRVADAVPRLVRCGPRFDAALEQLRAGDRRYLASPLVDSYHTLWFEFHEELIQLSGRTRASEEVGGTGA